MEIEINQLPDPVHIQAPGIIKKIKEPHLYFSDLFNAYSQSINKQEHRCGALFHRPFQRIEVDNQRYFKQLVSYIHLNPVHHGFTDDFKDYSWSSYGTVISLKPTKLRRESVLGLFNSKSEFVNYHTLEPDLKIFKHFNLE